MSARNCASTRQLAVGTVQQQVIGQRRHGQRYRDRLAHHQRHLHRPRTPPICPSTPAPASAAPAPRTFSARCPACRAIAVRAASPCRARCPIRWMSPSTASRSRTPPAAASSATPSPPPNPSPRFAPTACWPTPSIGDPGQVVVTTKGGTNQLHGSGFWYYQNSAFDAIPYTYPTTTTKPSLHGQHLRRQRRRPGGLSAPLQRPQQELLLRRLRRLAASRADALLEKSFPAR